MYLAVSDNFFSARIRVRLFNTLKSYLLEKNRISSLPYPHSLVQVTGKHKRLIFTLVKNGRTVYMPKGKHILVCSEGLGADC